MILEELYHYHHPNGHINFYGLNIGQNRYSINTLSVILENYEPKTIIEYGCGNGGLTILFAIYGLIKGGVVHAFDLNDCGEHIKLLRLFDNVTFYKEDYFSQGEMIKRFIAGGGKTLVFCDGSDKLKELEMTVPFLKVNDIILAHDYAMTEQIYADEIKDVYWSWHELSAENTQDLRAKYHLEPRMVKACSRSALCCLQKVD
jgi:cephalosporin hydroxylase